MNIDKLVVDTNGFLAGNYSNAKEIWTLPEVLSFEIRDVATKQRIELIKHTIKTRSPDSASINFVREFARKTGDIAVLSAVDIRLIALTYCLEKESMKDISHLRTEPIPLKTQHGKSENMDIQHAKRKNDDSPQPEAEILVSNTSSESTMQAQDNKTEDAESGWITAENYKTKLPQSSFSDYASAAFATPEIVPVACFSSDFAMQNVLLQIGLQLISSDGMKIRQLKNWILRCHACGYLERKASRRFCDSCGNNTLIRTSYSINQKNGEMVLYLKKNFQYNLRGTQYSLPNPKGGKQNFNKSTRSSNYKKTDIILREDQKEYMRGVKAYERSQKKLNADPDSLPLLLAASSIRNNNAILMHPPTIGYGRKNINESKK